ncbi:type II toxin-antitoxin system VapC family toxin [Parasediminibacterium sp. JCM 36343]|uniref:type II toxin-antitoxin system VapC family toxin n=1 Tax=Parasediminibacterium sp. JCM 36343 TaxID=3374279 RepID=UPI0039793D75
MILLDSNILIYSFQPQYAFLKDLIFDRDIFAAISAITILETIGYHNISEEEELYYKKAIQWMYIYNIDENIIEFATSLKKQKKMSIADAMIAATAMLNNHILYTRNTNDFKHIPNLQIINPIDNNE